MRRKGWSFLACILLALSLLAGPAGAVPARPGNSCVLDEAGVLSGDTVDYIVEKNQALNQDTGAAIGVLCVDFLDGKNIADYAMETFNTWQLGDGGRNNGVLILLAIGEDNYYVLQGEGLQDALSDSTLSSYNQEYLEEDFAAGRYDEGTRKLFDALYEWLESYYAGAPVPGPDQSADVEEGGGRLADWGAMVAFTVAVFVAVVILIWALSRGGGYSGYYTPYTPYRYYRPWRPFFLFRRHRRYGPPPPPQGGLHQSDYRPHTGSSGSIFHSGGSSRGGGAGRSSGGSSIFRSSSTRSAFRSGGSRGSFRSGGMSRGGGAGRR